MVYTVCFSGTACSRDEGEKTRSWARRPWQPWLPKERLKSDMRIYSPSSGYIPMRMHIELAGRLKATTPSVTVRGVGENDWYDQKDTCDPLLDLLQAPADLRESLRSCSTGNQRSMVSQAIGTATDALALHGANLAAASGADGYNFIGHSRGAVSSIEAAWLLYAYGGPASRVPINIFAIDPVPGPGRWWGTLTQLPPNVENYVGVYAWDHMDRGFNALVPRPNHRMIGHGSAPVLGGTSRSLADEYQLTDPLAPGNGRQPDRYKLYACRGRHGTVAGNMTADGLYDPANVNTDVEAVPKLIYKLARAYLTQWGSVFRAASAVQESVVDLRRRIHQDHAKFDAMGGGATRTSVMPNRPYVRRLSSISGVLAWNTYYMDNVVGDPPYRLSYPVTCQREKAGWVRWTFL